MIKKAFLATLPVMAGYIVLGIGFGIILNTKGYGVLWSLLMSATIYAGSMQYVALDLLGTSASLIAVAVTTLMVNCRHLFYGISMVDRYKNSGKARPYLIFALTDETYSLVCGDLKDIPDDKKNVYYLCVSLFDQSYWITGCVLGSLLGMIIPFNVTGIDFALTALFVTILAEQWFTNHDHIYALTGLICSVVSLIIFGSDRFLIPAMIMITVMLTVLKKYRPKEETHES